MNLFRKVGGAAGRRADGAALPTGHDDLEDVHPLFRVGPSRAAAKPAPAPAPVAEPEPAPEPEAEAPPPEPEPEPAEAPEPPAPEVPDLMELLPPELRQSTRSDADGHVLSQTPPTVAGDNIVTLLPPETREGADAPGLGTPAEDPARAAAEPPAPPASAPAAFDGDLDDALLDDLDPWDAPVASAPRGSLASLLSDGFRTLDEGGSSRPAPKAPQPEAPQPAAPAADAPPEAPATPPTLSSMLADGFRALDRAPAPAPAAPAPAAPAASAPPTPQSTPQSAPKDPTVSPAAKPSPEAPRALPSNPSLAAAAGISGLLGACLVDCETGLLLAREGGRGLDLDEVGAMTTQVLRAQLEVIDSLGLDDRVEDILMTTSRHLHVIRPLERMATVFIFLVLDRRAANLGMVRVQLARIEAGLAF